MQFGGGARVRSAVTSDSQTYCLTRQTNGGFNLAKPS